MMCQADSAWEWCRWIHLDTFCDFEWTRSGIEKIACDIPDHKVRLIGDYAKHQCGIRLSHLDPGDRGNWQCELEKYYLGFSRRYGETVSTKINLAVIESPWTSTTPAITTVEATTRQEFLNQVKGISWSLYFCLSSVLLFSTSQHCHSVVVFDISIICFSIKISLT